jgi:glycosyltransferase involved in cell wall biosynthesis
MEKLLFICPHLSTGGAPQFTLNKIELLSSIYDIYCIEYNHLSSEYIIQRNKIKDILNDKFIALYDNKKILKHHIAHIKPDIIMIEDISETFIDNNLLHFIYNINRKYKILETTHSSYNYSNIKKFYPDKFIFVSEYSKKIYSHFKIPCEIIEYPVDFKIRNQLRSQKKLGLDPSIKHIINIGLFTPGKNQGYIFKLAKKLKNENVLFHFIGNQAINFKEYWEPIIKNKPDNCIIWGERDDVDIFIQASDLFLFTSKFELNPLVIKEVLCYQDIPILMFNLETYLNKYNEDDYNIKFLKGDINMDYQLIKTMI